MDGVELGREVTLLTGFLRGVKGKVIGWSHVKGKVIGWSHVGPGIGGKSFTIRLLEPRGSYGISDVVTVSREEFE